MSKVRKDKSSLDVAIQELFSNKKYLDQVLDYCINAYKQDKSEEVRNQTKVYTKDALNSVASHVNVVAKNVNHYIALQCDQIEQIDNQVILLQQRIDSAQASVNSKSKCFARGPLHPDPPQKRVQQLNSDELPLKAKPLVEFKHNIDYSILDDWTSIERKDDENAIERNQQELKQTDQIRGHNKKESMTRIPPPIPSRRTLPRNPKLAFPNQPTSPPNTLYNNSNEIGQSTSQHEFTPPPPPPPPNAAF